jgi:hypothetical protein
LAGAAGRVFVHPTNVANTIVLTANLNILFTKLMPSTPARDMGFCEFSET